MLYYIYIMYIIVAMLNVIIKHRKKNAFYGHPSQRVASRSGERRPIPGAAPPPRG